MQSGDRKRELRRRWWVWLLVVIIFPAALWVPVGVSVVFNSPDCTGQWGVRTVGGQNYWRCEVCGAISYVIDANHETADRENLAGSTLDQLTKEGREIRKTSK